MKWFNHFHFSSSSSTSLSSLQSFLMFTYKKSSSFSINNLIVPWQNVQNLSEHSQNASFFFLSSLKDFHFTEKSKSTKIYSMLNAIVYHCLIVRGIARREEENDETINFIL